MNFSLLLGGFADFLTRGVFLRKGAAFNGARKTRIVWAQAAWY
jgi:hypothetical protein